VQPLAAVVAIVSVAVPGVRYGVLTGLVAPKLNVGGSIAPLGLEVIEAVSATLPLKLPNGVTVTAEALLVVAPAVSVTAVPVSVKPLPVVVPTVTSALPASGSGA
jgi:hypothetical protein